MVYTGHYTVQMFMQCSSKETVTFVLNSVNKSRLGLNMII